MTYMELPGAVQEHGGAGELFALPCLRLPSSGLHTALLLSGAGKQDGQTSS